MAANGGGGDSMGDAFLYAFLIVLFFFGLQYFYEHNTELCNNVIMVTNKALLYPFAFFHASDAQKVMTKFQWENPLSYSWDQMVSLTSISGAYWRWVLFPCACYMSWMAFTRSSIENMYQRKFTMRTLVQNNVKAFPCMAPVANIDILSLPIHKGPWRIVLGPLQFAVKYELILDKNNHVVDKYLLLNKRTLMANEMSPFLLKKGNDGLHLDISKTIKVLEAQVGAEFKGIDKLPPHIKGLAAAFMAYGTGDKKAGQAMLDRMSLSYKYDAKGNPLGIGIDGADALFAKYANDERILMATQHHTAYISTWIISLLVFARRKGVIACSQFIWLRPMDRPMFYALDQVGGRRPWSESIGPWVQYTYEIMAKQPIYEMFMESAATDLAIEIAELGFLDEKMINKRH